jgi:hypothetical protein
MEEEGDIFPALCSAHAKQEADTAEQTRLQSWNEIVWEARILLMRSLQTPRPNGFSAPDKTKNSLLDIINSLPAKYTLHPAHSEYILPQIRATASRKLIRYGPSKLPTNHPEKAKMSQGDIHMVSTTRLPS